MPSPRPPRAVTVAGLLLAVLVSFVVIAPVASAHAALLATTPGDAEILQTSPAEVTLTFGEAVGTSLGALKVLAADGARVDSGSVHKTGQDRTVHVGLRPALHDGTYVVLWRVVSADSHPVSGTFTFTVGTATAVTGYQGQIVPPHSPSLLLGSTRVLGFGGLLLWFGGAVFCLLLWPEGVTHRAVRRLLALSVAVELLAAVAALLLQGPYAAGLGIGHALDGDLISDVLHTGYGLATAARAAICLLAVPFVAALGRRTRPALSALAVLSLGSAVTWSAAGHGGQGALQPTAAVLDVTHLMAVSTWVGGLSMLTLGLRGRWDAQLMARVLPGWSRLATWAVALLVGSGLFASYREVRTVSALTTAYGGLLGLKVCLVVLMMFAGLTGRMWVRLHYGADTGRPSSGAVVHAATSSAGDPRPAPDAAALTVLRRSVRNETGLAVVVIVVTAVLVQTAPAASAYAPPYSGKSAAGPLQVQVDVYPARKGLNEVHLYTVGTGGRTQDVAEVTGTMSRSDGETFTVRPLHKSLGHYEDLHVVLPAKGVYTLTLQVRTSDIQSYPTVQTVRIR